MRLLPAKNRFVIAGNSQSDSATYFDPFYRDWVEAQFTEIGDGKYAVICRLTDDNSHSMFRQLKADDISIASIRDKNTILNLEKYK